MLNVSIGISPDTVKALENALRQAYRAGDAKLVKRVTALLRPSRQEPATRIAAELGELQGKKRAKIKAKVEQCGRTIWGVTANEPDVFRGPSWLGETNQYPFGRFSQRV